MSDKTKRILIGVTGSVATIKIPDIIAKFQNQQLTTGFNIELKIISTEKAAHFFDSHSFPSNITHYNDTDEWNSWQGRGDPVLHIDLTKWADLLLIAPLDANSLAKIANGICDNLLLCTCRAWDLTKPIYFCPAMNTQMWMHPITAGQIDVLLSWGYRQIPPISKRLMCGDTGIGAMADVDDIVNVVMKCLLDEFK